MPRRFSTEWICASDPYSHGDSKSRALSVASSTTMTIGPSSSDLGWTGVQRRQTTRLDNAHAFGLLCISPCRCAVLASRRTSLRFLGLQLLSSDTSDTLNVVIRSKHGPPGHLPTRRKLLQPINLAFDEITLQPRQYLKPYQEFLPSRSHESVVLRLAERLDERIQTPTVFPGK